ncbi:Gfo/Idh/MocA family protein [Amycolatopsis cihanbeyliensis]|uniref:Putative dehydrogenase n=1 Tax=Amycolatopsis cihanbeyliensis TaxID=1128664 RepID=A0A542DEX3_AMYCI|nr:Gfo/Idh/MocA family oxidoreductase [Amycolatopsis cihanbeyliensis]TQJ01622.1 putative dehydrogenase [Amycolatopsis cihanbeyliensis]
MDLLLIGLSRFAQRRVLPAAASIHDINKVDIVSSCADPVVLGRVPKLGTVYDDWNQALAAAGPSLVYVSLVNSLHATVVHRALQHGHHVVVDKPGLPDQHTAEHLVSLARESSLVLAEATCYSFHPLFSAVESILADLDAEITNALAVFTPPVPPDDWRWDRARDGGAIADTGPYAVSLGRALWGLAPECIDVVVNSRTADKLETSFSMLAGYPGGRAVVGQFGFTAVYQNRVRLMGKGFTIDVERPFSAPPDMAVNLHVRTGDQVFVHTVEPADSMQLFLSAVVAAVKRGTSDFSRPLLCDARALARLRRGASLSAP